MDGVPEELVAEEVLQLRVLVVGLLDVPEEDGADDAAAAPHQRDRAVVQLPREQLRGLAQQHEALNEVGAGRNSMEVDFGLNQNSSSTACLLLHLMN